MLRHFLRTRGTNTYELPDSLPAAISAGTVNPAQAKNTVLLTYVAKTPANFFFFFKLASRVVGVVGRAVSRKECGIGKQKDERNCMCGI